MTALPRIVADNPRMGSALLGSILVHLAVLAAVSLYLNMLPARRVLPSDYHNPLLARLVSVERADAPDSPPAAQEQVPVTKPTPEERPGAILTRPGPGPEEPAKAPEKRELPVPAKMLNSAGEPGPPFGARVVEMLFTRPFPRRFIEGNPLLNGQGYVRDVDLDERPRPTTLVIPEYPHFELVERREGWVVIAFFIDETGKVVHTAPVEGSESMMPHEARLAETLRRSTFTPGRLNGKPVKSIVFHSLQYNPDGWSPRAAGAEPK